MNNEMIVVRQLPIIEEQLRELKEQNQHRVESVLSMPCDENTVKALKKERAALNKEFADFETRRKEVKLQVLAPWKQFEAVYQDCVSNVFKAADAELKSRIDEVENGLKQERREGAEEYFNEYRASLGIDFVSFVQSGIVVTLTVSAKKLLEQVKAYLDGIKRDLELIDTQDHKEEILVEYKRTLNVRQAITAVNERHVKIEEERQRMEAKEVQEEISAVLEARVDQAVEEWAAPESVTPSQKEAPQEATEEQEYTVHFTVFANKAKIIALKKFLKDGGYQYE